MFGWSIAELRRRYAYALKNRDAAYLRYIHNDDSDFGAQDNKWALDKANREVVGLRREMQLGVK